MCLINVIYKYNSYYLFYKQFINKISIFFKEYHILKNYQKQPPNAKNRDEINAQNPQAITRTGYG